MVSPTVDPHGLPTVKPGTVPNSRCGRVVVVVVVEAVEVEICEVVVTAAVVVVDSTALRANSSDSFVTA